MSSLLILIRNNVKFANKALVEIKLLNKNKNKNFFINILTLL